MAIAVDSGLRPFEGLVMTSVERRKEERTVAKRKGKRKTVQPKLTCGRHGTGHPRLVCRHLLEETGLLYHAERPFPGEPFVLAWCLKCEAVLEEEGGWTERVLEFAGLQPVCSGCYKNVVRPKHVRVPLLA
jgi:hypothetical protein